MKNIFFVFFLIAIPHLVPAQADTEVYLFDLDIVESEISLSNPRNISNNDGYDNQPSFLDDNTLLYAATRADQTDIKQVNIRQGSIATWITDTPTGSEYSPLKIPNKDAVSAIRLDLDGLQRLYTYDLKTGQPELLLKDLKVGYHVWYSDHIIVSTVLVDNRMDLMVSNLKDNTNKIFQKNVGRSLHKIPNTDLIGYISKEDTVWQIKSLNPITGTIAKITNTYQNTEDMCWLLDGTILTGSRKSIMRFNPETDLDWKLIKEFKTKEINNITRIAVNEAMTRLAFVAELSPEHIVQKQVDTFNDRNLDGFVSCYDEDVWVGQFPADTMYLGRKKMRENYQKFFDRVASSEVKVTNRIVIGNKVIDQELADVDGTQNYQVAIYEIDNGRISSMNFIFGHNELVDPEEIVQIQLEAYNARAIEAFMQTYSDEVELLNYRANSISKGKDGMKSNYQRFFEATPDLHCEIKNRIVIGNKVIDEEYITVNGAHFSAVAIYEVENGKIARVTFLR